MTARELAEQIVIATREDAHRWRLEAHVPGHPTVFLRTVTDEYLIACLRPAYVGLVEALLTLGAAWLSPEKDPKEG